MCSYKKHCQADIHFEPQQQTQQPSFRFQTRTGCVDWRRLSCIDLDRVATQLDFAVLQENISLVTFSNVDSIGQIDPLVTKLLKLAQYTVEYLLHSQDYLQTVISNLEVQVADAKKGEQEAHEELEEVGCSLAKAKEEGRRRKKIIQQQQVLIESGASSFFKCPHCSKAFMNAGFLQAHIGRRHPDKASNYVGDAVSHGERERRALESKIGALERELAEERRSFADKFRKHDQYKCEWERKTNADMCAWRQSEASKWQERFEAFKQWHQEEMKCSRKREELCEKKIADLQGMVKMNQSNLGDLVDDKRGIIDHFTSKMSSMEQVNKENCGRIENVSQDFIRKVEQLNATFTKMANPKTTCDRQTSAVNLTPQNSSTPNKTPALYAISAEDNVLARSMSDFDDDDSISPLQDNKKHHGRSNSWKRKAPPEVKAISSNSISEESSSGSLFQMRRPDKVNGMKKDFKPAIITLVNEMTKSSRRGERSGSLSSLQRLNHTLPTTTTVASNNRPSLKELPGFAAAKQAVLHELDIKLNHQRFVTACQYKVEQSYNYSLSKSSVSLEQPQPNRELRRSFESRSMDSPDIGIKPVKKLGRESSKDLPLPSKRPNEVEQPKLGRELQRSFQSGPAERLDLEVDDKPEKKLGRESRKDLLLLDERPKEIIKSDSEQQISGSDSWWSSSSSEGSELDRGLTPAVKKGKVIDPSKGAGPRQIECAVKCKKVAFASPVSVQLMSENKEGRTKDVVCPSSLQNAIISDCQQTNERHLEGAALSIEEKPVKSAAETSRTGGIFRSSRLSPSKILSRSKVLKTVMRKLVPSKAAAGDTIFASKAEPLDSAVVTNKTAEVSVSASTSNNARASKPPRGKLSVTGVKPIVSKVETDTSSGSETLTNATIKAAVVKSTKTKRASVTSEVARPASATSLAIGSKSSEKTCVISKREVVRFAVDKPTTSKAAGTKTGVNDEMTSSTSMSSTDSSVVNRDMIDQVTILHSNSEDSTWDDSNSTFVKD